MTDGARPIALAGQTYDRISYRRTDQAWLDEAWATPTTRVLVVAGTRLRAPGGVLEWRTPPEAPDGCRVLLGEADGVTAFAVIAGPELAVDDSWIGFRAVMSDLDAGDGPWVAHAIGIAEWQWAVRHCPRCGGALEPQQSGHVLTCTQCGRQHFPRTDPAVIMRITDADDRILLGRQPSWPAGRWSTLAGFVEPGESLEQAVRREVLEEVGIVVGQVDYFGSQPWPLPASLMVGFTGHAETTDIHEDGDEIEQARWFTRDEARTGAEDGTLLMPGGISISRSLIEDWIGEVPGSW